MELELINLELELKFATKKLNPQINLPFIVLIQKYFFSEYKLLRVGIPSRYSEYLLQVPTPISD